MNTASSSNATSRMHSSYYISVEKNNFQWLLVKLFVSNSVLSPDVQQKSKT